MTHTEATYYLHRIYKILRDEDMEVALTHFRAFFDEYGDRRVICGEAGGGEIAVDPRNVDMADATIHEPLHILRPDWSERKVRQMTKQIAATLTLRQWRNLLQRFVMALY